MPARDLERYETVSTKIAEAIKDVNGNTYTPQPSLGLYATTGTFDDYVYSRHLSNPELRKTYGFTFETGGWKGSYPESFHPANPDPTKTEAKSGLLSLAQQCICAIELIGNSFFDNDDELRSLRRVRDEMLATTDAGRDWIGVFERSQGALIAGVVEDRELMSEAATLVKRIAAVVDGEEVTGEDLERADRLLGQISEYAGRDGVRKELELVRERAREFEGARGEEIIGRLMERPPREGDAAN